MGIIRILLVIAAIWLVWRLVSKVFAPPTHNDTSNTSRDTPNTSGAKMLRCEQCGVHVPDTDAFTAKGHHFCSAEHQGRWLEDHNV